MKREFTISVAVLALIAVPSVVFAQQNQFKTNTQVEVSDEVQVNGQEETVQVQTQTQTKTRQMEHEAGTGLEEDSLKEAVQTQLRQGTQTEQALSRRSQVSNSVKEMVRVADRNNGIGKQVRTIAQNQNQLQNEAEDALFKVQERGGFARFFIGPNYGQLKDVEERLEQHTERIEEMKGLRANLDSSDLVSLDEQIVVMEVVAEELAAAAKEETKGFSLFGWLNRLMSK